MAASVPPPVSIDQRFAQLIQQFGLTKNSFAMSLGKTASVVQHLIDGRNKPGFDLLCKVFEIYPNVSRDWLLLGRGPMLVSGEPAPKPAAAAPIIVAKLPDEAPLEPINISEFDAPAPRRSAAAGAGARLQPDEIMATLALAAAASQPARTSAPVAETASKSTTPVASAPPETPSAVLTESPAVAAPAADEASTPAAPPMAPPAPATMPAPEPAAAPGPPVAAPLPAVATVSPDTYITAALHAQHLQHQLALAELRNQHLQEQQHMLREMLAMARQSMV